MPLAQGGRSTLTSSLAVRLALTAAALVIWFWTQSLHFHPVAANALLIISSGIIDLFGIFLLSIWIFRGEPRPFAGLVIVLGLRQVMQACVALPAPPDAIWHYPGFPSLLVTYGVAYDYFFSGHTAIAVLAATELARGGKRWMIVAAVGMVLFEAAAVLILRAHYTMDVFTGLITGLYAAHLAERITSSIQRKARG